MTATEDRTITPQFVAEYGLQAEGMGYAHGRISAGDLRLERAEAGDFGRYYAAKHERDLDIDELYTEFVAARSDEVGAS